MKITDVVQVVLKKLNKASGYGLFENLNDEVGLRVNLAKLKKKLQIGFKNIRGIGYKLEKIWNWIFYKKLFLFFISQSILISILFFMQYQKKISNLRDSIFGQMKVCSWDLKCKEFSIDFATNKQKYLYKLYENKDAFSRIIDNLLSNAYKYNKKDGFIKIILKDKLLIIEDSGKGIKNPSKIFDRFYKENDRGIGIGLHIVKKLCDELDIKVSVKSEIGKGSIFYLDLKSIMSIST